jgi:hypothetical protein
MSDKESAMKRCVVCAALTAVVMGSTGCFSTTVTRNRFDSDREVVAVQDQVYIVNTSTGKVMTVDLSSAVPFVRCSDDD